MTNQKILFIGNETVDTDVQVTKEAANAGSINRGLISSIDNFIADQGFYHTSVVDLSPGQIVKIAPQFDLIKLVDQPAESYTHYKNSVTTQRLMINLSELNFPVEYPVGNKYIDQFNFWRDYLQKNKSFCFYPFLALVDNVDSTCICPKSRKIIKKSKDIINWQTDPDYSAIRNKMLNGELIPEHCTDCYDREKEGQESTRQYETMDWASRINAQSPEDFLKPSSPMYYEIRPSNKCNIMCRTCDDGHSHLIEKEWKKYKEIPLVEWKFQNNSFESLDFSNLKKVYVGGGEPTILSDFYEFLRRCISENKTDFELYIGTNGVKISNTLLNLLDSFDKVTFSFSYDGFGKVNDYIRWGSDFDTVVNNGRLVQSRGHTVALQTVFSMYSITRIHEIFEFYDQEYPTAGLLVQVGAGQSDIYMPFNHPRPDLVIDSLTKCKQTNTYFTNGRSVKSMVDLLLDFYSNSSYNCNIELLRKFFDYNDKLDRYRSSQLRDYIPELDQARIYLTK